MHRGKKHGAKTQAVSARWQALVRFAQLSSTEASLSARAARAVSTPNAERVRSSTPRKAKAEKHFGVTEKQFKRYYDEAQRRKGVTGDELLVLLERRLDNVVRRLGLARSIHGARQLVTHGHVTVNGRRVDIPSFHVRPGHVIGLSEKATALAAIDQAIEQSPILPPYLAFDPATKVGRFVRLPVRAAIPVNISERMGVGYYSR